MANSDFDKQQYVQDGYGNLYPRTQGGFTPRTRVTKIQRAKFSECSNCRVSNCCPGKGEKCNDFIA